MIIKVKNWDRFQHYKQGRKPIWIKLYLDLLEDYEYARLSSASKAHLIAIYLLAGRYQDAIPADDLERLKFETKCEDLALSPLQNAGFITLSGKPASKNLASCKQDAIPEERRGEGKSRSEEENKRKKSKNAPPLSDLNKSSKKIRERLFNAMWENHKAAAKEYRGSVREAGKRKEALDVWMKLTPKQFTHDEIVWLHAFECVHNAKWRDGYVQHLTTWLRGCLYDDAFGALDEYTARNTPKPQQPRYVAPEPEKKPEVSDVEREKIVQKMRISQDRMKRGLPVDPESIEAAWLEKHGGKDDE